MGKMKDLDLAFDEVASRYGATMPMVVCMAYGEFITALGKEERALDHYYEVKTSEAKEALNDYSNDYDELHEKLADVIIASNALIKYLVLDREKIIELMNKKLEKF